MTIELRDARAILALWSVQNHLAELRLQRMLRNPGHTQHPCPQGRLALICEEDVRASANPNFRQISLRRKRRGI